MCRGILEWCGLLLLLIQCLAIVCFLMGFNPVLHYYTCGVYVCWAAAGASSLISAEFVCSPAVGAPGCSVNGFLEGLSSLAVLQLSSFSCLDSVMHEATIRVLSRSSAKVHYSLDFQYNTHSAIYIQLVSPSFTLQTLFFLITGAAFIL